VRAWANLYPWDVAGDPAAADRIAGLGLAGVAPAASPVNPARHRCQPVASGPRGWCPASTASRATCSEVRDSAESRLTPRIRSMARSRS
jgi:hypothetical protein